MEEHLTEDMRIAAGVVKKIADENVENVELLNACKYVLKTLRKQLRNRPDSILGGRKMDAEERFGLYRCRVALMLSRDVNKYGGQEFNAELENNFAMVQEIVDEKIASLEKGRR